MPSRDSGKEIGTEISVASTEGYSWGKLRWVLLTHETQGYQGPRYVGVKADCQAVMTLSLSTMVLLWHAQVILEEDTENV